MSAAALNEQSPLFAAAETPLPSLAAYDDVVAGIDAGGIRKGFHAVALQRGQVVGTFTHAVPTVVAAWCIGTDACAVAVDAALCAVAAAYVRAGHYRAYGDRDEGKIFVPGRPAITRRAA